MFQRVMERHHRCEGAVVGESARRAPVRARRGTRVAAGGCDVLHRLAPRFGRREREARFAACQRARLPERAAPVTRLAAGAKVRRRGVVPELNCVCGAVAPAASLHRALRALESGPRAVVELLEFFSRSLIVSAHRKAKSLGYPCRKMSRKTANLKQRGQAVRQIAATRKLCEIPEKQCEKTMKMLTTKLQYPCYLGCVSTLSRSFAADVSYEYPRHEHLFTAACASLSSLHLQADFSICFVFGNFMKFCFTLHLRILVLRKS